ncbi:MAG: GGDEF domain-containing protein [Thalassolituus sp.]|jgi:diguanylate cyclase (GGDEF)-like protein|uniref:GGDEF domain-containing protein n=1 Tax=uncultured Thalassolituus sp. TaxID=285273 RepID=UPI00260AB8C0|nr:GGDEF domain-containing protein [uncultured Thalassolituus sp.]TNC92037.1 MAG: GGDEF domain-containing protein [Thalassolituus sp.]
MVSPLHTNGRAELRDDKVITPFGDLAPRPDIRPEVLLRLSGKLQTTLELSQLLEIFLEEIQQAVLVDGLTLTHDPSGISLATGRNSLHTANYRMQTQQDYMGDLTFHRSTRFREHELANIEGLLSTLVYPLRNALRYHEAMAAAFRDPLTGAGNRVALDKTLGREVELAKRHDQSLSVLMLDLDHFKQVNDEFGHSMGDKVLKEAVIAMTGCIRQTDMCFRYGGEEFLIMLSSADQAGALRIAERIRMGIGQLMFTSEKGSLQVTASIGCATLNMTDTMEELVQRADEALYVAKDSGRNRVISDLDMEFTEREEDGE